MSRASAPQDRTERADWLDPESVTSFRVEAATVCQLRCPSCPTTQGKIAAQIGSGYLTHDDFVQLVRKNPWIRTIELSNWGEIFLNPDLLSILKTGYEHNLKLTAANGANLNTARPAVLRALVEYRFRKLTCSIDGASQATYRKYRVRGNFKQVMKNIETINEHKRQVGSDLPELVWQFVIFGHNEREIPMAKIMAREMGMELVFKLSWDENISPPRNPEFIHEHTGLLAPTRTMYEKVHGGTYKGAETCRQLWISPQINFDQKILGCCANFWGDFGYAEDWDLGGAVNHEKLRYARRMLLGKADARDDIPCSTCHKYKKMKSAETWISGR